MHHIELHVVDSTNEYNCAQDTIKHTALDSSKAGWKQYRKEAVVRMWCGLLDWLRLAGQVGNNPCIV